MNDYLNNLDIKQKFKVASVLFIMFIILSVLFVLNSTEVSFFEKPEKSIVIFAFVFLLTFILYLFFTDFSKKCIADMKKMLLVCLLILITFEINVLFKGAIIVYTRPLITLAMLVTVLIGKKEGFFVNTYSMFLIYLFDVYSSGFEFNNPTALYSMVNIFLSGTVAVIWTSSKSHRLDTIMVAFKLGFISMTCGVLVYIVFNGISAGLLFIALSSYMSSHLSMLLYLGLLPVFEKIFNIVTIYRLNELTDHNTPLLKQLSSIAPGTFNHCLSVSKYAEACAIAIGEDPQIARVAAYYHDIGKIKNPLYFKENQYDNINPDDDLTPELSANFIKKHTTDGYSICQKYGLPKEICDICTEHHGTTVIKYFYYQAKKYTEGDLSTRQFRYSGPKPQTKIAAIIMICDAAEAVIRVLHDRSKLVVEKQVKGIIDERMDLEQFSDCDITMKDVYTIIEQIVKITVGIYHERTDYPKLKFSSRDGEALSDKGEDVVSELVKEYKKDDE